MMAENPSAEVEKPSSVADSGSKAISCSASRERPVYVAVYREVPVSGGELLWASTNPTGTKPVIAVSRSCFMR